MVLELLMWPRINRKHTAVNASNQLLGTIRVFSKGRLEKRMTAVTLGKTARCVVWL